MDPMKVIAEARREFAEQDRRKAKAKSAHPPSEEGTGEARSLERFGSDAPLPDILFDAYRVACAMTDKAKQRTSPENVCDVLDALVKIMRSEAHPNT